MSVLEKNIDVIIRGCDVLNYASNHKAYSICEFNLARVLQYLQDPISGDLDWWLGLAKSIHNSPGTYQLSVYSYPNRMGVLQITEVNIKKQFTTKTQMGSKASIKTTHYEEYMNTMFISDIKYSKFLTPIHYKDIKYEIH